MYEIRRYEMYSPRDWRSLAARASTEMDPEKLLKLVSELDRVLEEQRWRDYISDWNFYENGSRNRYSN
jgi:hypothetical protein